MKALIASMLLFTAPVTCLGQATTFVVQVVDRVASRPIPNSEIEINDGKIRFRQLADSAGVVRVRTPITWPVHVRVRQLGFQPVERVVDQRDSLVVALDRIVFVLPPVSTTEERRCTSIDSATTQSAASALEQLRIAADRYHDFRNQYPFRVRQERRTITLDSSGKARTVRAHKEDATSDEWGDPYVPGEVLHREALGFSVSLLFVGSLADSAFWARHCFSVRGLASIGGQRVVRMDFQPADGIRDVDWRGTVSIDSATSMLRRIDFQLEGLHNGDMPRRLEGFTTFSSPSPYVSVPDSTIAYWWRRNAPAEGEPQIPEVVQLLHVTDIRFKKATPPR